MQGRMARARAGPSRRSARLPARELAGGRLRT